MKDRLYYPRRGEGGFIITSALVLIVIVSLVALTWYQEKQKDGYDAEVKRLCAIDGGVMVYETVELPPEKFSEFGTVKIPSKEYAKPLDEFFYEGSDMYILRGNPTIRRSSAKYIRRSDGKVLGESVSYHRRGGDPLVVQLLSPPSSFSCPKLSELHFKIQSIFVKETDQ